MKNWLMIFAVVLFSISCSKDADLSNSHLKIVDGLSNFENEIESGVTLVFFHATWCSICKAQRPAVEDATQNSALDFVKFIQVDTDNNKDITKKYDVPGQPVLLFMKDGVEQQRLASSGHSQEKIANILLSLK
ncbi:MAG: thioredoxin family protein [Chitinophagales bacterium]|nr:thioredoxin family protein [Chitinophagales bacterium]